MEAHEVSLLVETIDGKCYRLASWVMKSDGKLFGRGSAYSSKDEAENDISPTYFQGTVEAKDISPVEVAELDVVKTTLLVPAILVGALVFFALLFAGGVLEWGH